MDHSSGLVFRRPQAASHRRAVVYFCSAVLTRRLFSDYRHQRRQVDSATSNLIAEAQKRLDQIDWIVQRIWRLQIVNNRIRRRRWNPDTPQDLLGRLQRRRDTLVRSSGSEIELLTESFYYFAWRLQQVLVQLPELGKFNPVGVREVRFDLLDHPEKQSNALNPNFRYGHDLETGPILKPFGARATETHDRGLYIDAQEFLDELLPRLSRASEKSEARDP